MSGARQRLYPLSVWFYLLGVLLITPLTFAAEDLTRSFQQQSGLEVRAWIEPDTNIVVSQQVNLFIELATPRWFTGGTRIETPEIKDVVVLKREKFAVNSIRRRAGQTWSVQQWAMTLYPKRSGAFTIPAIELSVSVANEHAETIKGYVKTAPIQLIAFVPTEITTQDLDQSPWLATTRLEVNEYYDNDFSDLNVGDSITRTIEIESENLAAMMLPSLKFESHDGLAAYHAPPKIRDEINRGNFLASRVESVTYIIEEEGSYTLPMLEFYWWDLVSQGLQHESLPERTITTVNAVQPVTAKGNALKPIFSPRQHLALILAFTLFLSIVVMWWFFKRRANLNYSKELINLERLYITHCRKEKYVEASSVLYQWLSSHPDTVKLADNENSVRQWLYANKKPQLAKLFDNLMMAAFSQIQETEDNPQPFGKLITEIKKMEPRNRGPHTEQGSVAFHLN